VRVDAALVIFVSKGTVSPPNASAARPLYVPGIAEPDEPGSLAVNGAASAAGASRAAPLLQQRVHA
jgi:hypothetical protein